MLRLATGQIRFDHSHVLTLFRCYSADTDPRIKRALVTNISLALEIHDQLEEEIFYPAMLEAGTDADIAGRNVPEHDCMRAHITRLRAMRPTDPDYDQTFMNLMNDVLHHVADEETGLLAEADRLPARQLDRIGMKMINRRFQLVSARGIALTSSFAQLAGSPLLVASQVLRRSVNAPRPSTSRAGFEGSPPPTMQELEASPSVFPDDHIEPPTRSDRPGPASEGADSGL